VRGGSVRAVPGCVSAEERRGAPAFIMLFLPLGIRPFCKEHVPISAHTTRTFGSGFSRRLRARVRRFHGSTASRSRQQFGGQRAPGNSSNSGPHTSTPVSLHLEGVLLQAPAHSPPRTPISPSFSSLSGLDGAVQIRAVDRLSLPPRRHAAAPRDLPLFNMAYDEYDNDDLQIKSVT
jgi:hypothetical protein